MADRIRIDAPKRQELNAEWNEFCIATKTGGPMVETTVVVDEGVEVLEYVVSDKFCDFLADRKFPFWFA